MLGYRTSYLLLRPHKLLCELLRETKFAWQRVIRGWDDTVWWSLDDYICRVCLHSLKQLRANGYGYPSEMKSPEEWDKVLDQMIDGFAAADEIINDTEKFPVWKERDRRWKELHSDDSWVLWEKAMDSEFYEMKTHIDMEKIEADLDFWNQHQREYNAAMERFNRGINLFKEYFFALWD